MTTSLMRPTALLASGLLTIGLLAGCTGEDDPGEGGSSPSASESASTEESTEPGAPTGLPIDRPDYTVEIPQGWEDSSDGSMINQDENSLRSRESYPGTGTANLTFYAETPYAKIEDSADYIMEQVGGINPKIKRGADTEFAGEPAIHTSGPGSHPGTWFQGFDLLHDGYLVEVRIETTGKKAANQQVVDQIESTWEWK